MTDSKRISRRELPDWFDIGRYHKQCELTASGWWFEIQRRWFLWNFFTLEKRHDLNHKLQAIFENPTLGHGEMDWNNSSPISPDEFPPYDTSTVRVTSNIQLMKEFSVLSDEEIINWLEVIRNVGSAPEMFPDRDFIDEYSAPLQKGFVATNEGWARIEVNLGASNEQLVDDFKKWLQQYREFIDMEAPTKLYSQGTFDKWQRFGVLPYIDLTLWAKYDNLAIPDHVMGEAIFRSDDDADVDVAERVRKVTRPMVASLMKSLAVMNALEAQGLLPRDC